MRRTLSIWAGLLPAAAAGAVWLPVLGLGFTSDSFLLPLLLDAQGRVAWDQVLSDWSRPWMGIPDLAAWRPLVTLHYALDLTLFDVHPLGFHLANLVLHLAAGLAVFAILRKILPRAGTWAASVGAFLYLVHPARAEAVAWTAGRVDVTPALPALLSILAFLRAGRDGGLPKAGWISISLLFAFAAYAGKEAALALPASFFFAGLLAFRGWRRFPWGVFALHLLLFGALLAWRVHVLGSLAGGAARGSSLAADYLATLPEKIQAAFAPPPPGALPSWAGLLFWVFLPLAAGLLRGRVLLLAFPLALWWLLLLLPAAPVAVHPGGSGTRVLLFPALAGSALAALFLGRPPARRNLWPWGSLRWIAGGGLCALAVAGLLFRLQAWKTASDLAEKAMACVAAQAPRPGGGPLGLVHLPSGPPGGPAPFRYDCAFLAFRPPFLEQARQVLVLENVLIPPALDAGPLHGASRCCRALLTWEPALGRFARLPRSRRKDRPLPLASLEGAGLRAGPGGKGILLPSKGEKSWRWLHLPLENLPTRSLEGIEAVLSGPSRGLRMVLVWAPPGQKERLSQGGDPGRWGPLFTCPLYPWSPRRRRWIGACGNRLGFYGLERWGRPAPMALAVLGAARLVSLKWLGRIPRPEWTPPSTIRIDPERPVLPRPEGLTGPARLVVLTPAKVLDWVVPQLEGGTFPLGKKGRSLLGFLARPLPQGRIFYYWERLACREDRGSVLERTLPGEARLGSPSTGKGRKGYPSLGEGRKRQKPGGSPPRRAGGASGK